MKKTKTPKKEVPIEFTFREQVFMGKLAEVEPDPENPRKITSAKYIELTEQIKANPNMLWVRPICFTILKGKKIVKAGNQRYHICNDLGLIEAPMIDV